VTEREFTNPDIGPDEADTDCLSRRELWKPIQSPHVAPEDFNHLCERFGAFAQ
jgi:hypothetical protein